MIDEKKLADELSRYTRAYVKSADGRVFKIDVDQDDCPESPRDWDNLCHILSIRGDWDIADRGLSYDKYEAIDHIEELKADKDTYIRQVYMLDHSGQSISLRDFCDRWDSGICGYIYVSKQEVFKCFGETATEDNWKELADETMKSEIEIYDQYIKGDVYCFGVSEKVEVECKDVRTGQTWIEHRWEDVDSCGGFYGNEFDKNGMFEYVFESLPDDTELTLVEEDD